MPRSASVVEKADATVFAVGEPILSNFAQQRRRPFSPALGGEAQEDLLARLEVAQQGRLVHADRVGDIGKGDLPDTALGAERRVPLPGWRLRAVAWPLDCGPSENPRQSIH